jgi:hypothetical protein
MMEKKYWIGRKREAMRMARTASTSQARLIHYQLAGLYSLQAVRFAAVPLFAPLPFATSPEGPPFAGPAQGARP